MVGSVSSITRPVWWQWVWLCMCVMKQGRSCTDAASTRAINQTEAAAETVQIGLISLAISRNQGARTGTGRERKIEWDREGEIRKWRITKITEASLLYRVFQYIQIDTCKYFDLCNRLPILRRHLVSQILDYNIWCPKKQTSWYSQVQIYNVNGMTTVSRSLPVVVLS